MPDYDEFGDIIGESQGIFADGMGAVDDGLKRFDKIVAQVVPEGMAVDMACRKCGKPRQLTVFWPELVAIRCNVSPFDAFRGHPQLNQFASRWRVANVPEGTYWMPEEALCRNCGAPVAPLFSPDECTRHIAVLRNKGWLTADDEVAVGRIAMAAAARR